MANANEYPRKPSPADGDDLIGVADPNSSNWSVRRMNIGALLQGVRGEIASLEARATALENDDPTPDAPPGPLANLIATDTTSSSVSLAWSRPTGGGSVASYNIYRNDVLLVSGRTTTAYTDTNVSPGQTYVYGVEAVGPGGVGARGTITVSVPAPGGFAPTLEITSGTTMQLPGGGTAQIVTQVQGNPVPYVSYTSSNPSVATVSTSGLLTWRAEGTTTITVLATNSEGSASAVITVHAQPRPTPPTIVITSGGTATLESGVPLNLAIFATGTPEPSITYQTSDPNVATVTPEGVVHWVAPGEVFITARATNTAGTATDVVTVNAVPVFPPDAVTFVVHDDSFSPILVLHDLATADVEWRLSDNSQVSTSLNPTFNFPNQATRYVELRVNPWSAVRRVNIGFLGEDGAVQPHEHNQGQAVSFVANMHHLAPALREFYACYNPITRADLRDFTQLEFAEFFRTPNMTELLMRNNPNLRRFCIEYSGVQFVDISSSVNIEDVRGSSSAVREIRLPDEPLTKLWHFCSHSNGDTLQVPYPIELMVYVDQLWVNSNWLGGHFHCTSPRLRTGGGHPFRGMRAVWAWDNNLTSADFTNCCPNPASNVEIEIYRNLMTSLIIDGCPGLIRLEAHTNLLPREQVDYILGKFVEFGRLTGEVDLRQNSPPTPAGMNAVRILRSRNWNVLIDAAPEPQPVSATVAEDGYTWTVTFNRAITVGAGGGGGMAADLQQAGAVLLTYQSGSGTTTLTFTGSVQVEPGDTAPAGLSYVQPGNGLQDQSGALVPDFSAVPVTNNSESGQTRLLIARVEADGVTWHLRFNRSVSVGPNGANGFTGHMNESGQIGLSYVSGVGTNELIFTGSSPVATSDEGTISYTQPGQGIVDMESMNNGEVANYSRQGPARIRFTSGPHNWAAILVRNVAVPLTLLEFHYADGNIVPYSVDGNEYPAPAGWTGEQEHVLVADPPEAISELDLRGGVFEGREMSGLHALPSLWRIDAQHAHTRRLGLKHFRNNNPQVRLGNATNLTPEAVDQMIIELDQAGGQNGSFYYPAGRRTSASDEARASLAAKGWSIA